MADPSAPGPPAVIPYLYHRDAAAMLRFLVDAFGFEERTCVGRGDGAVMHAELRHGDQLLMLGSPEAPDAPPPADAPRHGSVLCYVDDVDAHCARAQRAGAHVFAPLEDKPYGDRMYGAADPEGQHWYFATRIHDPDAGAAG